MKDLILKHKSLLGGYERIEYLERLMSRALQVKTVSDMQGFNNSPVGLLIIRTRTSIDRILVLTNHINNNY